MKQKPLRRTRAIDWQAVHQRLARANTALADAGRLSPERAGEVMAERARTLARVPVLKAQTGDVLQLVSFALADERYGIETRYVREVLRFTDFTPVPGVPDFLVGVTKVRGEILAVIDLRKFLNVGERGLTDLSRVIVLGDERAEFGILADAVDEVIALRADEILEAPASVSGIGREYLRGVTPDALIVLDGVVLLQDARLSIDHGDETSP
jgi:purine-binding chemotaxis protein CheW